MTGYPILHDADKQFLEQLSVSHSLSAEKRGGASESSKDSNEFVLHLYDKLWENVTFKENRLWTFLTVYGDGIGILLGSAATGSLGLLAGCLILILTYWATELVMDADWWSVRNRLMISRIEERFPEAIKGVSTFYRSHAYFGESIHRVSLIVFAFIGGLVFLKSIGYLDGSWSRDMGLPELSGITVLYAIAVLSLAKCLTVRERRIAEYHRTLGNLVRQLGGSSDGNLGHDKWRNAMWIRVAIIGLYVVATAAMSGIYFARTDPALRCIAHNPAHHRCRPPLFSSQALLQIGRCFRVQHRDRRTRAAEAVVLVDVRGGRHIRPGALAVAAFRGFRGPRRPRRPARISSD